MGQAPEICIDRVLPAERMQFQRLERVDGRVRAIEPIGKRWIQNSTLHVKFLGGTAQQRSVAKEQALWWIDQAKANLKFVFDDAPTADIRISFDADDGAWSYVGTDNKSIPLNEATMNLGFLDGGTAAHEFGHAIGLAHEHQNPAGGIKWDEAKVLADLSGPPNFWTPDQIRHNVLRKYSADQIKGTTFDPKSIMLYFFPATWTTNGIGTEANEVLSAVDRSYVGERAYPRGGPAAGAVKLTVNAAQPTPASIGKAGEEDLFTFVVDQSARHVIETSGSTDVMMKLFGPGSQTDLIASDDDSGLGFNARIAANLVAGTYWVQIRHYRRASGVGAYAIGVSRV